MCVCVLLSFPPLTSSIVFVLRRRRKKECHAAFQQRKKKKTNARQISTPHSYRFFMNDLVQSAGGCGGYRKPTYKHWERPKDADDTCYVHPSPSPAIPKTRPCCQHVDDYGKWHNMQRTTYDERGRKIRHGYFANECTSFNATCGEDADDLMRFCIPEVFVDHAEVRDHIAAERALSTDTRFNMGNQRYSRFNDYRYVGPERFQRNTEVEDLRQRQRAEKLEEDRRLMRVVSVRGDQAVWQPKVSAAADVFDVWPTVDSEFPVMMRRPEDYTLLYTRYT